MDESTDNFLDRIRLGEDSSLELKDFRFDGSRVTAPSRMAVADELAAMANASGGVFAFGVSDKTRKIAGVPPGKEDAAETWVRDICNDLIQPPLPASGKSGWKRTPGAASSSAWTSPEACSSTALPAGIS